jgi:ABC-type branched-subunit amino acid transport system substrate-binding protein
MAGSRVRIGVLHDFPVADEGRSFERYLRLGMSPVIDSGRLDDEVEIVHATGRGLPLPGGSAHAVEEAFASLVAGGVVAIVGPAISDNALVVRPLADAACVPTLNYSGSEETRSEYCFQYQIGSLEDEPSFLAAHLVGRGLLRVAVERDRSYVGRRMADYFEDAAAVAGVAIVARADADAIASLGMWDAARALATRRPSIPVVANSALIYGYSDPVAAGEWEGWAYPDTVCEQNRVYAALGDVGPGSAGHYDMGRLIAEALARARVASRRGVLEGLEQVKAIPAASGEPGTLMGFGRCDRGALKGRYLVIRQWRNGRSITD